MYEWGPACICKYIYIYIYIYLFNQMMIGHFQEIHVYTDISLNTDTLISIIRSLADGRYMG